MAKNRVAVSIPALPAVEGEGEQQQAAPIAPAPVPAAVVGSKITVAQFFTLALTSGVAWLNRVVKAYIADPRPFAAGLASAPKKLESLETLAKMLRNTNGGSFTRIHQTYPQPTMCEFVNSSTDPNAMEVETETILTLRARWDILASSGVISDAVARNAGESDKDYGARSFIAAAQALTWDKVKNPTGIIEDHFRRIGLHSVEEAARASGKAVGSAASKPKPNAADVLKSMGM